MNAVNDNRELTDAEIELVAGGMPGGWPSGPTIVGQSYDAQDLYEDVVVSFAGWIW